MQKLLNRKINKDKHEFEISKLVESLISREDVSSRYADPKEQSELTEKITKIITFFNNFDDIYEFKKYKHRNKTSTWRPRKQFYPVVKNWDKIRPHLDNPDVQRVLVRDFNKFTAGCWGERFRLGQFPHDFEDCPWFLHVRGRHPEFFSYVKHRACHWLANFNLTLAMLTEPKQKWRILRSDVHSTVWDGCTTLFDFNGLALFKNAGHCFRAATSRRGIQFALAPGELLKINLQCDDPIQITGLRIKPLYPLPRRKWAMVNGELSEIRWLQGEDWYLIRDLRSGGTDFVHQN